MIIRKKGTKFNFLEDQLQFIKAYQFIKLNEKDLTKIFIDEIYSSPPRKKYPSNKKIYNHINEIWSIDSVDMIE